MGFIKGANFSNNVCDLRTFLTKQLGHWIIMLGVKLNQFVLELQRIEKTDNGYTDRLKCLPPKLAWCVYQKQRFCRSAKRGKEKGGKELNG